MRRFIALGLALLAPVYARAAGPTCALLDPEKSPRVALLEAKLLADPSATWVERADIDKVLKEQKLQAAFTAQGVGDRVKLGKLLKAEVLVMVRPVKAGSEPALEVVIGETGGGLRLLVRAVPITADVEADLAAVHFAVKEGLRKYAETVKEVVAVPPLLSNDLEFTHDYLRGAFAKLMESEALGRPGVVVVELAEAEALAKEFALTAPGSRLDRPLPLYLLGEFRNEGKGAERTITLKLRAERGGKVVGTPETLSLKGDAAPAAVRKWAGGVLDTLAKDNAPRPPADPKAEAKVLNERAKENARLGNWPECLALVETSLLLDPNQPDCHAEAIDAIVRIHPPTYPESERYRAAVVEQLRTLRRAFAHLEAFADKGGNFIKNNEGVSIHWIPFFAAGAFLNLIHSDMPPEVKSLLAEVRQEHKVLMARLQPLVQLQQQNVRQGRPFDTPRFVPGGLTRPIPPTSSEKVLRRPMHKTSVPPPGFDPRAKPDPAANRIEFTPVPLRSIDAKPTDPLVFASGLLAAGPGVDVVWSGKSLYLMTEKGKLRLVWTTEDRNNSFESLRFDGRYVWVSVAKHLLAPQLFILDPISGKIYDVTPADGLPEPTAEQAATGRSRIAITTLDPGRACVAGGFGRAWIATVLFDPRAERAKVTIIHEAREVGNRDDKNAWSRTTIAFVPSSMFTLREKAGPDGKEAIRVLLGRGGAENYDISIVPLLVDPNKPSVEVSKLYFPIGNASSCDMAGGALYRAESIDVPRLLRLAYPGTEVEYIAEALPRDISFFAIHEGRSHFVVRRYQIPDPTKRVKGAPLPPTPPPVFHWYTLEPGEKRPKVVGVDIPAIHHVAVSNHYGLIALSSTAPTDGQSTFRTVTFDPPLLKK